MKSVREKGALEFFEKAFAGKDSERINKHWKDVVKHSIWVYSFLKEYWANEDICIAGLFHDMIEDTSVTENDLEQKYWKTVKDLVKVNTSDKSLWEYTNISMIKECAKYWFDALLIKSFDIYDSYLFYKSIENYNETKRSINIKNIILKYWNNEDIKKLEIILDKIV